MRLMSLAVAAALALTACGQKPTEAPTDGEAVRERAEKAQTARRRTGAELQARALNRVIRTVYLCNNGERLSVDFDNPREMATVRNSNGEAVDLFREQAASGLWYRASGYELRGEGVMASWTADGREPTDCRAVD
jgi:predicted small lipoprotein YifL